MDSVQLIESTDALRGIVDELQDHKYLGVDTEFDGFYSYFEKTCLIQVSTPERDIIIDPLAIDDLSPLRQVLETPRTQKIMHASNNDLLALQRDYGFRVHNLFDTAIAWQLLGHKRCGLAHVLQKELDVKHQKKSRYQRCDWAKRPLQPAQIEYARLDTHYLISLRHRFDLQLSLDGLRSKADQKFSDLEKLTFEPKKPDPSAYLKIKGAQELDSRGRRTLKALYRFRERLAQRQDRSPFRVITNQCLLHLARNKPQTHQDLTCVHGLPRRFKGHQADVLLAVIHRANQRWLERYQQCNVSN